MSKYKFDYKMSKPLFYSLVVFNVIILVYAIFNGDIILSIIALLTALYLKKVSPNISIPKTYLKNMGMKDQNISTEDLQQMRKKNKKKDK